MTSTSTKRRKAAPRYSDERPPVERANAEKEIQRLRAAMVNALGDFERIASLPDARSDVKRWAAVAARNVAHALGTK